MSSQRFERRDETTITPKELTPSDLTTYTIKSGKTQLPLDRLLTKQGQALNIQADELEKKDDELKEIKKDLKEEKDANTSLKRRIKEMNKELEKYKSDLDTIDQEKKYVGDKNKELTDEKKRLEAVVTGMSKKDENIEDIRDTYERSLQEHRNHIMKLEKALEKALEKVSKDNYDDIRRKVSEEFDKRDKMIIEREKTIAELRGIVEKNIKDLAELRESSLSESRETEIQQRTTRRLTKQLDEKERDINHLNSNLNLALKARDLASTNLQKVTREYQTYRREAESYKRQTEMEKRELIEAKDRAEFNVGEWRKQLEATMSGDAYKKPFNDGYKKGLVDGKKNVNQDLINQIDDLKKVRDDLRTDLDEALARELQWGTTMETIKTAKVAKKTKDANLNTNNPESNYNITSGTRRTRTTRQPSTLLPRAEQVEQARVIGTRTLVAQQAAVAPVNQTGVQGRVGRLAGLLGRRTRALRPGSWLRRGNARVVADAPGGASNKNKTKKIKGKKSRKERKKKSQIKKR